MQNPRTLRGPKGWSNREITKIQSHQNTLYEQFKDKVCKQILTNTSNSIDYYQITPIQELPKLRQKTRFQSSHSKQKDMAKAVQKLSQKKQVKKQNKHPSETPARKKLKEEGNILLLSEIYQSLGQNSEPKKPHNSHKTSDNVVEELQNWQKVKKNINITAGRMHRRNRSRISAVLPEDEKNAIHHKEKISPRLQIQKGLEIIEVTHANQKNPVTRLNLIENSSRILKKELDLKITEMKQNIEKKKTVLFETRTEHHNLFLDKTRLIEEEKMLTADCTKQQTCGSKISSYNIFPKIDRLQEILSQKKTESQQNLVQIETNKKIIESLEKNILENEDELRELDQAESLYYKASLKNGADCREGGYGWVLKKLNIRENNMNQFEFPSYMDKKSKLFLVSKSKLDEELEDLLNQKKSFMKALGRSSIDPRGKRKSQKLKNGNIFKEITQEDTSLFNDDVPGKYRRSKKKITLLQQQFSRTQGFFDQKNPKGCSLLSTGLSGLTGKQIYQQIGSRIKMINFNAIKKDKGHSNNRSLDEYHELLECIKEVHIEIEDLELHHEMYLLSSYKYQKDLFFILAAACFGSKKAYEMIIKHFSWKNDYDHL